MPTITTLEDAQAEIIRLQEQLTQTETERDTLSQNNEQLTADLARVRLKNQEYFEKLSSYYSPQTSKTDNDEKEAPTCEEFAKTLNI